ARRQVGCPPDAAASEPVLEPRAEPGPRGQGRRIGRVLVAAVVVRIVGRERRAGRTRRGTDEAARAANDPELAGQAVQPIMRGEEPLRGAPAAENALAVGCLENGGATAALSLDGSRAP